MSWHVALNFFAMCSQFHLINLELLHDASRALPEHEYAHVVSFTIISLVRARGMWTFFKIWWVNFVSFNNLIKKSQTAQIEFILILKFDLQMFFFPFNVQKMWKDYEKFSPLYLTI